MYTLKDSRAVSFPGNNSVAFAVQNPGKHWSTMSHCVLVSFSFFFFFPFFFIFFQFTSLFLVPQSFSEFNSLPFPSLLHPKPWLQITTPCHTPFSPVQFCIYISHLFTLPMTPVSGALLLPWSQLLIALLDSHPILSQISSNQDSWRPSRTRGCFTSSDTWYQTQAGYGKITSITACFMWCHDFQYPALTRKGQKQINSTLPAGSLGNHLGRTEVFQKTFMYHSFKVSSVLFCPSAHAGALYINGSLDFEASHEYYLSIEGTRKGSASLSDVTMVVINITDINDHAPEFIQDPYFADIREDAAVGEIILTVWLQKKKAAVFASALCIICSSFALYSALDTASSVGLWYSAPKI